MPSKNRTLTHWIEKFQTVLQSLCQLIAPHGVRKSLFLTHPQQHGVLLKVWVDTDLIGENWHLVFFFMYTSLIPSQAEHFSLRLLARLISHLANILFIFFAYFPSSCFSFLFLVLLHVCYVGCKYFQLPFSMLVSPSKPCGHWNLGSWCFDLYPSVICFPSATWSGGRFVEKTQRGFVGLKPLLQVCGVGSHLHLSQWLKTISYTSPPNSSLQGMWIKHLLSPFPHNLVPLWLGTTRLPWTRAPSS